MLFVGGKPSLGFAGVIVVLMLLGRRDAGAQPGWIATDLGTLGGGGEHSAYDVDNYGRVVGARTTPAGVQRAFVWTAGGGLVDLGTLGGASSAFGITDAGQVVGFSNLPGGPEHAFLWTSASGMTDLGTLGGPSSVARGADSCRATAREVERCACNRGADRRASRR